MRDAPGTELLHEPRADPWWMGAVPALERIVPPAPYADGWTFMTPVIDMPRYLRWLPERVLDARAARSPGWRWPGFPRRRWW